MINFIQGTLRKWGYELRRYPKDPSAPIQISSAEKKDIDQILQRFSTLKAPNKDFSYPALKSYLNDQRMVFFHRLMQNVQQAHLIFNEKKIADVGCGMSYLLRCVANQNPNTQLYGYDPFADILPLADMVCPQAKHQALTIEQIDEKFDIIFCTEVLEHLVAPEKALKRMQSLLTPQGSLILSVPDGRLDSLAAGQIHQDGNSYWGHIHFWSPESWEIFLKKQFQDTSALMIGKVDAFKLYAIITPA